MTVNYTITFTFTTDRPMTDGELADMEGACTAQIVEPMTWTDQGDFVDADFKVSDLEVVTTAS